MASRKNNRLDHLILDLTNRFADIQNFHLTQEDPEAKRFFNFLITRISEIQEYKALYKQHYIPSVNKAIARARNDLRTSIYRKQLEEYDSQLKENYYDIIRLGYVGLFHKIEFFVKDLLKEANLMFIEDDQKETIEEFAKEKFSFSFTDYRSDIIVERINWICNCVKHYGGYPLKKPKYKYLTYLPENKKIEINHKDFYDDMDHVSGPYFELKLTQVLSIKTFKSFFEESKGDADIIPQLEDLEEKLKKILI